MFGDVELGQGQQAPGGPQAVVIAQSGEAHLAAAQRSAQVTLHAGQVVGSGGDMQRIDHDPGGLLRRQSRQELSPDPVPGLTGEDVGLQLGAQQRPGFTAQTLDHMAEIDPPQRSFVPLAGVQPLDRLDELTAQEQIQPVMAQVHRQLLADQPRGHAVGDRAHLDRAGAPHPRHHRLVVGKALHRQRLQMQPLDRQLPLHLRAVVEAGADLRHQLSVVGLGGEITAAALEQLLLQPMLPVPVRALDGTVLMGYPAVVAGGDDAQVGTELAVAAGVIPGVAAVAVAEAGAEAVGAVLRRHPAAEGQGVLQRLTERHKALAAVDHRHMAPARERQAEVEQPVLQHLTTDRDRRTLEQREIGEAQHPGTVLLQEHHLLARTVQRPPLLHPTLDRAFAAKPLLAWECLLQVQQQGLGFQLRRPLQHGHQHAVPDIGEGIGAGTPVATTLLLVLRLQLASLDALGAAHRDPHRISGDLLAEPA